MMEPFCVIGVTGHRRLSDANLPLLRQRVRELLSLAAEPHETSWLATSLAEGADRLVAEEALALGYELYCPLPFATAEYEKDFDTPESVAWFRDALARSTRVERIADLATATRTDGYTAAGRAMLDASRTLLALWDGLPPRGEGGTGQMVHEAIARGMPVFRILTTAPHDILVHTPRIPHWQAASRERVNDSLKDWRPHHDV
jgi:hypothetical protein